MFPESHGFVAVPVTRSNNFVFVLKLDTDKLNHVSLIQLVTDLATKPCLGKHITKYKNMKIDGRISPKI